MEWKGQEITADRQVVKSYPEEPLSPVYIMPNKSPHTQTTPQDEANIYLREALATPIIPYHPIKCPTPSVPVFCVAMQEN